MHGRTGTAQLPLHGGRAPAWLFGRMVQLAREMARDLGFYAGGGKGAVSRKTPPAAGASSSRA